METFEVFCMTFCITLKEPSSGTCSGERSEFTTEHTDPAGSRQIAADREQSRKRHLQKGLLAAGVGHISKFLVYFLQNPEDLLDILKKSA
jgi:hypothetical protein